jgi:hypothetical protein
LEHSLDLPVTGGFSMSLSLQIMDFQKRMKKQFQNSSTESDRKTFDILLDSAKSIGFTKIELQQLSKVNEQTVSKPTNEVTVKSKRLASRKRYR